MLYLVTPAIVENIQLSLVAHGNFPWHWLFPFSPPWGRPPRGQLSLVLQGVGVSSAWHLTGDWLLRWPPCNLSHSSELCCTVPEGLIPLSFVIWRFYLLTLALWELILPTWAHTDIVSSWTSGIIFPVLPNTWCPQWISNIVFLFLPVHKYLCSTSSLHILGKTRFH